MAGGIDWFRWHHGSVTDPKFGLVAKKSGARLSDVLAVWAFVLESASANETRGVIGAVDAESLEYLLDLEEGTAFRILDAMTQRGLLGAGGVVVSWEKRQPKREDDTAAERKRRQREREHELALSEAVTPSKSRTVTQGHDRGEESREEEIQRLQRAKEADELQQREAAEAQRALLEAQGHKPTPAGAICKAMKAAGLQAVNPGDPRLLAMIAQGATTEEFVGAATDAVSKQKGFAWALSALAGKRTDAQALKLAPPADGGPTVWHETQGGVDAMASRLGLPKWDGCVPWKGYRATILKAAEAASMVTP